MMLVSKRTKEHCSDRSFHRTKRDWSRYLCEVHAQTNLREKMHDNALVLLHRLALAVVITVIVAIKRIWVNNRGQGSQFCNKSQMTCFFICYTFPDSFSLLIKTQQTQKQLRENSCDICLCVCFSFLPASVVPLDMDELRDSVVSGRFNAVSSLVRGEAAGGPEGLRAQGAERRQEAREMQR